MTGKTPLILKTMLATAVAIAVAGVAIGFGILRSGWYDIGATTQHLQMVHTVLEQGMQASVQHQARDVTTPALDNPDMVRRGGAVYGAHCMQCHGGPGAAPQVFGMSMQPVPGALIDAASRWRPREMYWITRHGIKMSGMPAWEYHLSDRDLWSVVAFLVKLPELTPQAYAAMASVPREKP